MTNLFLMTTVALLSIAASPVVASENRPATAPTTEAPQAAQGSRVATPAKKYCVVEFTTGSRLPRKTCKTRDAWLEEGFDPLVKQ